MHGHCILRLSVLAAVVQAQHGAHSPTQKRDVTVWFQFFLSMEIQDKGMMVVVSRRGARSTVNIMPLQYYIIPFSYAVKNVSFSAGAV